MTSFFRFCILRVFRLFSWSRYFIDTLTHIIVFPDFTLMREIRGFIGKKCMYSFRFCYHCSLYYPLRHSPPEYSYFSWNQVGGTYLWKLDLFLNNYYIFKFFSANSTIFLIAIITLFNFTYLTLNKGSNFIWK